MSAWVSTIVLFAWIGSTVFLVLHGVSYAQAERKTTPGLAVMIMAGVTFLVLTVLMLRVVLGIVLPNWIRIPVYLLILIGIWWKLIALVRVRYGEAADEDRIGV